MPSPINASYPEARLLIVDDNPTNVLFLERLLKKMGYTDLRCTTQSQEAARIACEERVDLAIIDLHMPVMSGFELLQAIREHEAGKSYLPVLVFTADATGDARRRALELGASDFLTKPGDPSEIVLRVRNFLYMRSLQRKLEDQNAYLEERVRERTRRLEESQLEIVQRLALAGDYRDDDTGDHCHRVGKLAYDIAIRVGLSPAEADLIRVAAPLHDIGKVAIGDAILKKPGRLTHEEFDEMRRHVRIGAEILAGSSSEILQMAHTIALSHHERWDGSGYGVGLSGDAIPLPGRIVAVADVFDALTSVRPYKRRWTVDEAVREIISESGRHFDPAIVEAFLEIVAGQLVAAA